MELTIKNIKQFEDRYFYIPNDHVLIHGNSGAGKSTILDCIYFAITGKRLSKKWSLHFGSKTASVHLKVDDLEIYRTINPQSLKVNNRETDDEAQAIVDAYFNTSVFAHVGYAIQKTPYMSILSAAPRERMLIMERMLFTGIDTDAVRAYVKTRISDLKHKCTELDGAMGTFKDANTRVLQPRMLDKDVEALETHVGILTSKNATLTRSQQELAILKNKLHYMQSQSAEHKQDFHHLEVDIVQLTHDNAQIEPFYKTMQAAIIKHDEYAIIMNKYTTWKTNVADKLTKAITDIESQLAGIDIDALNDEIEVQRQMMPRLAQYRHLEKTRNNLGYDPDKHAELASQYKAAYYTFAPCPKCGTQLCANFVGIEAATDTNVPQNPGMMLTLEKTLQTLDLKKGKYLALTEQMDTEHKKLIDTVWTEAEYESKLETQNKHKALTRRLDESRTKLTQGEAMFANSDTLTRTLSDDAVISDAKYKQYERDVHKYNDNKIRLTYMNNSKTELETKLKTMHETIGDTTASVGELATEVAQMQLFVADLDARVQELAVAKQVCAYQKLHYEYIVHKQEWDDTDQFLQIFTELQRDYMINTLNNINLFIKKYIDGFFDDEIVCTFYLNTDKKCIDFDVTYSKMRLSDHNLSTLSGGEYDRVMLAIYMSFAEYFKLPVVLLDEIINSLDAATAQRVLEHVHASYPSGSIIYVGHQVLTGLFSHVIHLDMSE